MSVSATAPPALSYVLTDEQRQLQEMVRDLLTERATSERVREVMLGEAGPASTTAVDRSSPQYGLLGLTIPEAHGGAGATFAELAIVLEEAGRAWRRCRCCRPRCSAPRRVLGAGHRRAARRAAARGRRRHHRLALAHLDVAATCWPPTRCGRHPRRRPWTLDGTAAYVIDGARPPTWSSPHGSMTASSCSSSPATPTG
jgi:hypothetical protein